MTRWFYVAVALTLVAFGVSGYVYVFEYDRLPEQVPTHWNVHGEPDAFSPKEKILPTFFLMPGVMVALLVLTPLLAWLSPVKFKVEAFRDTYGYVMMLVVALMGYLHVVILLASLGHQQYLNRLLFSGIFLFFALMGNVLGKVRRNFWMGVRTPWTLASDTVWIQTHRLAAWLFVVVGLLGFVAVLLGVPLVVCFVGVIVAALVPVLYSLVLYKRLERAGRLDTDSGVPAASSGE
jgi:uncharacterized membrane protein